MPVGTSGRLSICLPHCHRANELASTNDVLAGFADGSAMGQGSVAAGTRLSLGQAGDVPLLPPVCANVVGKGRGQVLRLTWTGSKGDNCGYAGHTASSGTVGRGLMLVVSDELISNN